MWFQESPYVPTYAYRCSTCAHEFDIFQKFSEDPLKVCPECGGETRRVFQPVGIVFKGSGWYINDSRQAAERSDPKPSGDAKPSSDAKPGESKGDSAPVSTAAKTETAAPAKVAAD
jgi:putative FmdB family regulatory protein